MPSDRAAPLNFHARQQLLGWFYARSHVSQVVVSPSRLCTPLESVSRFVLSFYCGDVRLLACVSSFCFVTPEIVERLAGLTRTTARHAAETQQTQLKRHTSGQLATRAPRMENRRAPNTVQVDG